MLPLHYRIAVPTVPHFEVPAVVILHLLTLSLFSVFWFNGLHDKLPRIRKDDPSALKGILFLFIPVINFYWLFFTWLRLCDRINEQRELLGLRPTNTKALCLFCCILMFIPYVNLLSILLVQPILFAALQTEVNEIHTLGVVIPTDPTTP